MSSPSNLRLNEEAPSVHHQQPRSKHSGIVDVIDGKVWLQADNTDLRIAERLEGAGIPKGDIVLGFQPLSVRPYTEYAVA